MDIKKLIMLTICILLLSSKLNSEYAAYYDGCKTPGQSCICSNYNIPGNCVVGNNDGHYPDNSIYCQCNIHPSNGW